MSKWPAGWPGQLYNFTGHHSGQNNNNNKTKNGIQENHSGNGVQKLNFV